MHGHVPLESAVVRAICRYLDSIGAWWVKSTGVAKVGCPDLLCCYRGQFLAIEVKREDPVTASYGVTKKQQYELQRIGQAGGVAMVAWNVEMVKDAIEAM